MATGEADMALQGEVQELRVWLADFAAAQTISPSQAFSDDDDAVRDSYEKGYINKAQADVLLNALVSAYAYRLLEGRLQERFAQDLMRLGAKAGEPKAYALA